MEIQIYETWEALKYLSENPKSIFKSKTDRSIGTLTLKFDGIGVVDIRNQNGAKFDLCMSTFQVYKWLLEK